MTHFIQVATHPTNDSNRFNVAYSTNLQTGVLPVAVDRNIQDPAIVAELFALRHLLELPEIGAPGITNKPMTIIVSKGAIKKLIQGRSSKAHLLWCARWLKSRYLDANIEVSHKQMPSYDAIAKATRLGESALGDRTLTILGPLTVCPDSNADIVLESPIVGACTVSMHAIERFMERSGTTCWSKAWEKVAGFVQQSESSIAQVPECVMRRKRVKYGERETIVDVGGGWFLVFSPDRHHENRYVLCTVYFRNAPTSRIAA